MKRILYVSIISGILLSWIVSCAPVHRPTVINAPLMKKQGDVHISGHISIAGVEANAGAALSDHVGIVVNSVLFASSVTEQEKDGQTYRVEDEMRMVEGGLGFFNAFKNDIVIELYGGFGYGYSKTLSNTGDYPDRVEARGYRYFIQPAFGYSGDIAAVGIATRVIYLDLYDYHDYSDGDTSGHRGLFYEPALFFRFGMESVKIEGQGGFSLRGDYGDVDHIPLHLSLGLRLELNLFSI